MAPWLDLSGDGPVYQGPDPLNIGSQHASGGDGTGDYSGDLNGPDTFGDGSNEWIPGIIETFQNPVDRVTNPYDTVAGAADALTINFDEGVGGLVSLVDGEPGNTAGPGQTPWLAPTQEGQPDNPGTTGSPVLDKLWKFIVIAGGLWLLVNVVAPAVGLLADLDAIGGD